MWIKKKQEKKLIWYCDSWAIRLSTSILFFSFLFSSKPSLLIIEQIKVPKMTLTMIEYPIFRFHLYFNISERMQILSISYSDESWKSIILHSMNVFILFTVYTLYTVNFPIFCHFFVKWTSCWFFKTDITITLYIPYLQSSGNEIQWTYLWHRKFSTFSQTVILIENFVTYTNLFHFFNFLKVQLLACKVGSFYHNSN